jgi:hypothetical protein
MVDPVVHRLVKDRQAATICNRALLEMWDEYDWRESIAEHPPFYIIPNIQDYPGVGPFNVTPTDFRGLRQIYIVHAQSDPPSYQPLNVLRHLEPTTSTNIPSTISYEKSISGYRLFPRPPKSIGAPKWFVAGNYKIEPTSVTNNTLASNIPLADDFLETFIQGIKWAAFDMAGDQRAGGTQVQDRFKVHTGQYGVFQAAILAQAMEYGLDDGDPKVAPSEPLAVTGFGNGGSLFADGWFR